MISPYDQALGENLSTLFWEKHNNGLRDRHIVSMEMNSLYI